MAQPPKPTDPKAAQRAAAEKKEAAEREVAERDKEEREEREREERDERDDRRDTRQDARQDARRDERQQAGVPMPGRPPQPQPVEGDDEPVTELTKAEQEAGKETLEAFGEQLKAEQELGAKLVEQYSQMGTSRRPTRALPPPQSGPRAPNPLHGNPRG